MGWTTPVERAIGTLITKAIWDSDIRNNLRYLKGMDGQIIKEDDLIPNSDSLKVGESANPWSEGHFYSLMSGPRMALYPAIREQVIVWETDNVLDISGQIGMIAGGGGNISMGGTGQAVGDIDDNTNGSYSCVYNLGEQNSAFDTSFNVSRYPYARFEIVIDAMDNHLKAFIGFRRTPSGNFPDGTAEHMAGFVMSANNSWSCDTGNASAATSEGISSPSAAARHVFEIYVNGATNVEFWLDGSLVKTITGTLPTGDLEWTALFFSLGTGGVGTSYMTYGKIVAQEALS